MINNQTASYDLAKVTCQEKMAQAGIDDLHISIFGKYFDKLFTSPDVGYIREKNIQPVKNIDNYNDLSNEASQTEIDQTVIIKLNGGLATTMGLEKAKVLLPLKDNRNFLDYIVSDAVNMPLIFMTSFRTSADTLEYLKKYPALKKSGLPLDFKQSKEPKIDVETFYPVDNATDPSLEWCPPGHGDIFVSMLTSGILDGLLNKNIHYAFISNSDNLAAIFDKKILKYFIDNQLSFLSEVTKKTPDDVKGGHIVKTDKGLILREFSQISPQDEAQALDTKRHPFVNTNSIWVNLDDLKTVLQVDDGYLDLPLIKNIKTLNPRDKSTKKIIQLETAMGAGIGAFTSTALLATPRSRFLPVKNYDDLDRLLAVL
ncbi:MAG: UTP--glucose-1-phosphate uridylyltransferase [Bifidobacteriaceae bacterium]|nr:UTP--glucose-1-phosphate uridylyltransferase [Bifidobacteriaceae bacterium]